MNKRCLGWILACLLAWTAVGESFSPWEAWRNGYAAFERGEKLRDQGNVRGAAAAFREARKQYENVRKMRPEWNQKVISGRISMCDQELDQLAKRIVSGGGAATPSESSSGTFAATGGYRMESSAPSAPALPVTATSEYRALKSELEQYKQRLFSMMTEIEDLRRQAALNKSTAAELENLMREKRILIERYTLLEKKYREAEERANRPDTEKNELKNRLIEEKLNLELLNKKLQLTETKLAQSAREITELYSSRAAAQAQTKKLLQEQRRFGDELERTKSSWQQAIRERSTLQDKLREASAVETELKKRVAQREDELRKLAGRIQSLQSDGSTQARQSQELLAENRKRAEEISMLQSQLAEQRKLRNDLESSLRELRLSMTQLRGALATLDVQKQQFARENAMLREQQEKQLAAVTASSSEQRKLRDRIAQLEDELKVQFDKGSRLAKRLEERSASQLQNLTELNSANRSLSEQLSALRGAHSALLARSEELSARSARLETANREMRDEYLKLKSAHMALEIESKKNTSLQPRIAELQERLNSATAALTDARAKHEQARSRIAGLEKNLGENAALKKQLGVLALLRKHAKMLEEQNRTLSAEARQTALVKQANLKLKNEAVRIARERDAFKNFEAEAARVPGLVKQLEDERRRTEELRAVTAKDSAAVAAVRKKQFDELNISLDAQRQLSEKVKQQLIAATRNLDELKRKLAHAESRAAAEAAKTVQANHRAAEAVRAAQTAARKKSSGARAAEPVLAPIELSATPERAMDDKLIREYLANALEAERNDAPDIARWHYEKILESNPANLAAARGMGRIALKREDFAEAERYLNKVFSRAVDDPAVRIDLARAFIGRAKFGNALNLLEAQSAKLAKNADFQMAIGLAYAGSARAAEAEKAFQTAARISPKDAAPRLELARILARGPKKRHGEGARIYQAARKLGAAPDAFLEEKLGKLINENSEVADFLNNAAREAESHNDLASAVWYYKQLLELDKNDPDTVMRYAFAQYRLGKYDEALKLLATHGESVQAKLIAALALDRSGRFAEAGKMLRSCGKTSIRQDAAWRNLALEADKLWNEKAPRKNAAAKAVAETYRTLVK